MAFQIKIREVVSPQAFDDFVRLTENRSRSFELIGGEIVEMVSHPSSSKLGMRVGGYIHLFLMEHDIGHLTGADGGYRVGKERYIPDNGFISYKRMPELIHVEGYIVEAPDLAVEVLSPSNTDQEIRRKVTNYGAAGTLVWVVNPEQQVIEVYRPGQAVEILDITGTLDGEQVLPGFKLLVKSIFLSRDKATKA